MTLHTAVVVAAAMVAAAGVAMPGSIPGQAPESSITGAPSSIRAEHADIHRQLEAAVETSGRTGAAARALSKLLHPHFVREEVIALPPLGALAILASGRMPPDADTLLAMTNSLRRELPQLLEEHAHIRSAVDHLRSAARAERAADVEQLADRLALHAQTEEEVLYPAAILAGEVIAARRARAGN